jgi:hypothetical protein
MKIINYEDKQNSFKLPKTAGVIKGLMAEWFKASILKIDIRFSYQGFESFLVRLLKREKNF